MTLQPTQASESQQQKIVIDASKVQPELAELLTGTSIEHGYGVTKRYLLKEGKPWLPAIGEFHYLRCPRRFWEDAVDRLCLGGIDVLGTYVFWNHHEEEEGVFDWSGDRNLREFLAICKAKGLKVLLRVGPFAHGEARNGALPDWLYTRGVRERSNDPEYLAYVRRYLGEVEKQVRGLLIKDDGPIIAIQIENEYQASGAPWEPNASINPEYASASSDGADHIVKLRELMQEVGLETPFYTCTAWDGSPIPEGIVPMQFCYPVNFWASTPEKVYAPNKAYMIVDRWTNPSFGGGPVAYTAGERPYLMVEMGVGMQPTIVHRPWVPPEMSDALSRAVLGGGSNSLGYYMYHGGTQMVGKRSFLNEGTLPRLNYDYQAPIGEYGEYRESFYRLRLLHYFMRTCGESLAPMQPIVRAGAESHDPADVSSVQYSVRSDGRSGFLFLSNYQTGVELQDLSGLDFDVKLQSRLVCLRDLRVAPGISTVLPVVFDLGGVVLAYATAEPIDRMDVDGTEYWLFAATPGMSAKFVFDASTLASVNGERQSEAEGTTVVELGERGELRIGTLDGRNKVICVIPRREAERVLVSELGGRKRWIHSSLDISTSRGQLFFESGGAGDDIGIFPPFGAGPSLQEGSLFSRYPVGTATADSPEAELVSKGVGVYAISIPELPEGATDLVLVIDYLGDHAFAYVDGQLVADHYNLGDPWRIRMGRMRVAPWGKEMILRFGAMGAGTPPEIYIGRRRGVRGLSTTGPFHLDALSFSVVTQGSISVGDSA